MNEFSETYVFQFTALDQLLLRLLRKLVDVISMPLFIIFQKYRKMGIGDRELGKGKE